MTLEMTDGEKRSAIDEAAEWYFKRDAGPLSGRDETAFRARLADPANRAAFAEIDRTWADLGLIARPAAPDMARSAAPARIPVRYALRRRVLAAAAVLVAVLALGYTLDVTTRLQADAYTARGESRSLTLDDGTNVALNTATAIAVDYSASARRVRLLQGEALFTVAKDAARPFTVLAAGGETRALGTAFAVREEGQGATVTVLESRVGVSVPAGQPPGAELSPGQAVSYSARGIGAIRAVDADGETAWRRGKLIFVDRPLGSVIAELNRYHAGRIQIANSAISGHLVSGVFDTKDPVRVLDAIESSLGLHSTRLTRYLILLHR
jgi:transmembrane sensor